MRCRGTDCAYSVSTAEGSSGDMRAKTPSSIGVRKPPATRAPGAPAARRPVRRRCVAPGQRPGDRPVGGRRSLSPSPDADVEHPGVVHGDVETPETIGDRADEPLHIRGLRDVRLNEIAVFAELP